MSEMILGVDIETASALDIKNGAWAYSLHESTKVYCVVFILADRASDCYEHVEWEPEDELPPEIAAHIKSGGRVLAHNVGFEKSIFANLLTPHYDFPLPRQEQWVDTQAMGNSINLPARLEGLAAALGCSTQKNTEGAAVMKALCKLVWFPLEDEYRIAKKGIDTRANRRRLIDYCVDDVAAMMDAYFAMQPLDEMEQEIWDCDQRVNQRGVYLDQEFAAKCNKLVKERQLELADEAFDVTAGHLLNSTNSPQLKAWLIAQHVELPLVVRHTKDGVKETPTANRQALEALLKTDLPPVVRELFNNRMEANKAASLSKLERVPTMVGGDGRLRYSLNYSGTSTGRWIAYGLQVQNMPKVKLTRSQFELVREVIAQESLEGLKLITDRPLEAISQCLRSVVAAAPGKELIAGDFSSIEARGVAWLADQTDVLEWFHQGKDVYVETAASIGSDNRQLGKVCTLALGFGMGPLKFHAEAAKYGITLELKEAKRIQKLWRENNPQIVEFWGRLEDAVREAIDTGKVQRVGRLTMWRKKSCLFIRLPSGRCLRYWRPSLKLTTREIETVNDEGAIVTITMTNREIRYYMVSDDKNTMRRDALYGGKIADHVTQALARDLLAASILRVDETDPYDVVIHVHDSVCAEVPTGAGSVDEFCALMEQLPSWADGMPVAVEGYRDRCFRG